MNESLAERKARLTLRIQQQRLDLLSAEREWLSAMAPVDAGWGYLARYKWVAIAGSGILATWQLRHPGRLIRLLRRGPLVWSAWRLVRNMLR
jgi:hypothetical protein